MTHPQISIVIRCYNEEDHIGKLLDSLAIQTIQDFEIIIVDSGSTDKTLEIVSRYPCKVLHIESEDFSFGRALNMGCSQSKGAILVFASAHVYPINFSWLEELLRPFSNPLIAGVYGRQVGAPTTHYSEHRIFSSLFPENSVEEKNDPFCNNANCAIRRDLWKKFPYDEELTGLEDLDWGKRVIQAGFRLSYSANASIVHVHNETTKQIENRFRREAIALKKIFPDRGLSFFGFLGMFLQSTILDWMYSLKDGTFVKSFMCIPQYRFFQFYGTYRGSQQVGVVSKRLKFTFYRFFR